jgi:hypothetical protein
MKIITDILISRPNPSPNILIYLCCDTYVD